MTFFDDIVSYMEYIPQTLQDIIEINAMSNTIDVHLNNLNAYIGKWINNALLLENTTVEGVERWEKILNIYNPLVPDLQSRINNIRAKLITRPPINEHTLKKIIEAYMGVEVDIEVKNYKATIWYRGTSKIADLKPLYSTIYSTIPSHIMCEILYRFVIWNEQDSLNMVFDDLDIKKLVWNDYEKGEWIK